VSDLGRVRSWRRGKWGRRDEPRIMSPGEDGHVGHVAVNLCLGDGTRRRGKVHRLVAEAFIGPIPAGLDVRHLDGNPKNNRVGNLAFGTRRENMADAVAHGTVRKGSAMSHARLSEDDVLTIGRLRASGLTQREVGAHFGVTREAISRIEQGRNWKHLPRSA
jgi:hypothetical protein